eukprot:NODE_93_length_21581_cov_0.291919.p7 type:complete len:257 gc:universal NODE_93_length_21581_cov_0.291919:10417-11187(+)
MSGREICFSATASSMFITGFGPFPRVKENPSLEVVKSFIGDNRLAILPRDKFVITEWVKLVLNNFYGSFVKLFVGSTDSCILDLLGSLQITDNSSESNLRLFFDFNEVKLPVCLPICCAVSYEYVQKIIEFYWKQPFQYSIHVGVGQPGAYKLELLGNINHSSPDIYDSLPTVVPFKSVHTVLPVAQVFRRLRDKFNVELSTDAGSYVCDYTMAIANYCSRGRSLFIHVPSDGQVSEMIRFVNEVNSILQEILDNQ